MYVYICIHMYIYKYILMLYVCIKKDEHLEIDIYIYIYVYIYIHIVCKKMLDLPFSSFFIHLRHAGGGSFVAQLGQLRAPGSQRLQEDWAVRGPWRVRDTGHFNREQEDTPSIFRG